MIAGKVQLVSFNPGRQDGMLRLHVGSLGGSYLLAAGDPKAEITWNGEPVLNDLVLLLDTSPCSVTLYPLNELYGVSLKAEFRTG